MAEILNPIAFADEVNKKFQNYQLTAFPLSDPDMYDQAYKLLTEKSANRPLIKGPFVSLSRSFKTGRNLLDLAKEGKVHPALPGLTEHPRLFMHQDRALDEILKERNCLISTGTGSGKTESFLYPILNHCLKLRDAQAPEGVVAVIVYPMNALAIDQRNRLREMLAGSGISFGLYIGTTAENRGELSNTVRLKPGEGRERYFEETKKSGDKVQVIPAEERLLEKEIAEQPPRLLLTNVKQLELLMTRSKDIRLFTESSLKYLVFDEAHTYSGVSGAEVSCLIRRLRTLCGKNADEVVCVGTSATIIDPELGDEAGVSFASRFFGVDPGKVSLVQEEYEREDFPQQRYYPVPPADDVASLLESLLIALDKDDQDEIKKLFRSLTGKDLVTGDDFYLGLYEQLKGNEYVYSVFHHIKSAQELNEAANRILIQLKRKQIIQSEQDKAELLCYLALGAAAKNNDSPLLRPKIHYFVKGLEGAVVVFEKSINNLSESPRLFLSRESAYEKVTALDKAFLPVFVCKTCGQHYFESFYKDIEYNSGTVSGGQAEGDNVIWIPADDITGLRVLLTNRFVLEIDSEEPVERLDRKRAAVWFCSYCGTLHKEDSGECCNPKCRKPGSLVQLYFVKTDEDGLLSSCPSCGALGRAGGRRIEPVRPIRATTVADVHILAQNMINSANPKNQKLIVFADNRQDAAFQAGWMQDHARRYRFRHLVYEYLSPNNAPVSIGDIQNHLFRKLKEDRALARLLAPEVFDFYTDEAFGGEFEKQLKYYLRIQILRELATGFSQRESLENWGLLKVVYKGIDVQNSWIQDWSAKTRIPAKSLADAVSILLDIWRRNRYLYDRDAPVYSRAWNEGASEVQQGYFPIMMGSNNKPLPPQGISELPESPRNAYKVYFRSGNNRSLVETLIKKWNIPSGVSEAFLKALWIFLTNETKLLTQVTLTGSTGNALSTGSPVFQVDTTKIGLQVQWERYQCNRCQRNHSRPAPGLKCSAYNCNGELKFKEPSPEDYNVSLLKSPFSMIMPQEHSAQVPPKSREVIEDEFKNPKGRYNCLVATPTLELGVDIGALDMVLMRNVPPKSSNYWQRAGRAGRKHRLAVIYTYIRRSDHDNYFYRFPDKLLAGSITTPKFNLRNEVLLRKHVHSAVLSELLNIIIHGSLFGLSESDLQEVENGFRLALPTFIKDYLFNDAGEYLLAPYNVNALHTLITKHQERIFNSVTSVFSQYWPQDDEWRLGDELLRRFILEMTFNLQATVDLLHQRMMWAVETQKQLNQIKSRKLLSPEDERILDRCASYLKDLHGTKLENYTLTVLANEGFLPGYGLYDTGVKAFAHHSFLGYGRAKAVFELSRAPIMALREYVPGNMIYANSGKFKVVLYRFPVENEKLNLRNFSVNLEKNYIHNPEAADSEVGYSDANNLFVSSVPISDSDIHLISRISDEEANRFQMPVKTIGKLQKARRGGKLYNCADHSVQLLFGQKLLLLNLGPVDQVKEQELGFPICTVCGAARSPYASEAELINFRNIHKERCGREPGRSALTAEDMVDGFLIQGFENEANAFNFGEAVIVGAARMLEMERNDLGLIVIGEADGSSSLFLYDPMPGGSGILQQIADGWVNVLTAAKDALQNCPSQCEASCYDCLRTYYNAYYQKHLDRLKAVALIEIFLHPLDLERILDPNDETQATGAQGESTNIGEKTLGEILEKEGFPPFKRQHEIKIGAPFHRTIPDFYYEDNQKEIAVAIYLDGLSKNIHGNEERARVDSIIRQKLEILGISVVEISSSTLNDPEALKLKLAEIAAKLKRKDLRDKFMGI